MKRWALVAAVLILVVGAGVFALIGADRATADQESVHRSDRLELAQSLSTLASGYFLELEASQANVAASIPASLLTTPPAASTRTLGSAASSLPGDAAVVLVSPTGSPLSVGPGGSVLATELPAVFGSWGQPAGAGAVISQVMDVGGHASVVIGVGMHGKGFDGDTFVVAYRLDALPIAAYVQQLRIGVGAVSYIVDRNDRMVTNPSPGQIGHPAPTGIDTVIDTSFTDRVTQTPGSSPQAVAVSAVGLAGWHLVIVQPAPKFYGTLWHANTRFRWLLLGFLLVVAAALLLFHVKRQTALHKVAEMAVRDPLTALPNRVAFTDALTKAMNRHRRDGANLALLFCDLDGFKAVNDQLGHDAGDLLLVASAQRLNTVAAGVSGVTATVARLGGDEFTILLEGRQVRDRAMSLAQAVTESIAEPFVLGSQEVQVGVSVGVAYASPDRDLLRDADVAMYRMKAVRRATREAGSPDRFSNEAKDKLRAV